MVAFTKEEMERADKRLAEINKPYKGLSKAEIKKRKIEERDTEKHHKKIERLKKELEGYKMELRTLEIKPQDSQMKTHLLPIPDGKVHRGHKASHTQRMNKGQYI